jgi:hypothetical protein
MQINQINQSIQIFLGPFHILLWPSFGIHYIHINYNRTWMYFMKVRSETFVVFKIFKSMVENLKDLKINTLHLDWGGDYISKEFIEFCQQRGIVQQLTIVDTLHQNGVVATLLWAKCGGEAQHSQSWELGVLRDSRMFRARHQGLKHLALRLS